MKKALTWLLVLVLVLGTAMTAQAAPQVDFDDEEEGLDCFTVIYGKDTTPTGYVMVSHNEDDGGRLKVNHGYVEPATWPAGTILPAETGRAAIPQVENTYGFYWLQAKGLDRGLSNADGFLNENGVYVCSNSNASSKENAPKLTDGGIEYNLRRVIAERAESARDAVDIIIDMVETYGYAPSGRAYTVADKDEGWMVQIVSGNHYVAVRVPDDHVAVMPNFYTVHSLDDYEDILYSPDLIDYAIERGWYVPAVAGDYSDFDFALAYQAAGTYRSAGSTLRQQYGQILLGVDLRGAKEPYPFSVKPEGIVSFETMKAIQSYHFEGTPDDNNRTLPNNGPHDIGSRRICTGTTIESLICQFTEDVSFTTLWSAFGRPCELPYIPLHPLSGSLPTAIQQMQDPAYNLATHLQVTPGMGDYENTGWQKFRDFENMLEMVYDKHIDDIGDLKDAYEEPLYAANLALISAGDLSAVKDFDENATNSALEQLQEYAAENMIVVPLTGASFINRVNQIPTYDVIFTMPDGVEPAASPLRFGMGFQNTNSYYYNPVANSLTKLDGNRWKVSFNTANLVNRATREGVFEYFLGGQTTDGKAFTGMIKINFLNEDPPELILNSNAHLMRPGDYFTLNASFAEEKSSNAAILTYTFDGDKFEYANFTPAVGVGVVNVAYEAGKATITVMSYDYDLRDFGDIMLRVKEDAVLEGEYQTVKLDAEYVLKDELGGKTIKTASATKRFVTSHLIPGDTDGDGIVDLIDLSNMIDWFGTDSSEPLWETLYIFFDFNNSGDIDIYDISYVAKLIG